ncbi:MAG: ParB/RepB/Spo0J family partition protein [bacterium]|nr:ParB/RepB/Spo0J family partition protein [bacterium]
MSTSSLGRGLSSLIPSKIIRQDIEEKISGHHESILELDTNSIKPNPHQPRQKFDRDMLEDLINSIKEHGIIQPLVVYKEGSDYKLIAGERRHRAAKVLGLEKVPVVIRTATEQEKLELAIVENIQRQNLNPIEKAFGYKKLADDFNLTQDEVAKKVGQSRVAVTNTLRLLSLAPEIQEALKDSKITEGHAKVLLGVSTPEEQIKLFKDIVSNNLSVRKVESKVQKVRVKKHTQTLTSGDPNLITKQDALQEALGTKVEIKENNGQGTITIHYYSKEELREIINKIAE